MATEKLNTEIRQEQIAQAALSIIAAHGLKGLSVSRTAKRVGLVPSAIYRHYGSKGQILDAVIDLIRQRLQANVAAALEQSPDALERLQWILMAHVRIIRENQGILRILFSDDLHLGHPGRKARVYEMITGYLERVAEIVRQGVKDGQIRDDLDPAVTSALFLGLIQPAAILWHMSDGEFDVTRQVAKAWPVFADAIRA